MLYINSACRRRSWGDHAGGGKFYTHNGEAVCLMTTLTCKGSLITHQDKSVSNYYNNNNNNNSHHWPGLTLDFFFLFVFLFFFKWKLTVTSDHLLLSCWFFLPLCAQWGHRWLQGTTVDKSFLFPFLARRQTAGKKKKKTNTGSVLRSGGRAGALRQFPTSTDRDEWVT